MQKLKEWIIAAQLEKRYTKDEILTMYLNKFDWVNNAVGIKSAASVYFNKKPFDLNVEESAMLVGMLKNPALYNPNRRKELTESRRNVVLSQMNKYDLISDSLYETLSAQPIKLDFKQASHNEGLAPYFREYLRGQLKKWCSSHKKTDGRKYNLYTDGLKIYTTINSRLQQFAEEVMKADISSLEKDFYKIVLAKILTYVLFIGIPMAIIGSIFSFANGVAIGSFAKVFLLLSLSNLLLFNLFAFGNALSINKGAMLGVLSSLPLALPVIILLGRAIRSIQYGDGFSAIIALMVGIGLIMSAIMPLIISAALKTHID